VVSSPQEPEPEQIAQLQQQLADAAAQVADVKARLEAATGVPADDAREQWATQLFEGLSPLDLGAAPPGPPAALSRLADPPRRIPFTFRIAAFAWSWWEGFAIVMGVVAPIALWAFFPELIPSALISAVAVIAYLRGRKAVRRLGLVKHGVVATVTNADELDRGTYYSGTTYSNMWVTQAHGWDVTRTIYSGPASKTRIEYAVGGVAGSLVLRGLPYEGGVILAHPTKPVALCVNQFVYDVKPGPDGQMVGGLRTATWIGIPFTLAMELGLVVGAIFAVPAFWF
jgi:hypothetical protein